MHSERRRDVAIAPTQLIALLTNIDQLGQIVPRAERVEVLQRNEARARLAVTVRVPRLGAQRVEGEARFLEDGLRFIAVTPTQIDIRWTARPSATGSEIVLRLEADLAKFLGPLARFVPNQLVDRQVGEELEAAIDALIKAAAPSEPQASNLDDAPNVA